MGAIMKYLSENVMPALIVVLTLGLFNMYTDLLLLKNKVDTQEKEMVRQQKFMEKFDDVLQKMDRALTIQGEALRAIQTTVQRIQDSDFKKEVAHDR